MDITQLALDRWRSVWESEGHDWSRMARWSHKVADRAEKMTGDGAELNDAERIVVHSISTQTPVRWMADGDVNGERKGNFTWMPDGSDSYIEIATRKHWASSVHFVRGILHEMSHAAGYLYYPEWQARRSAMFGLFQYGNSYYAKEEVEAESSALAILSKLNVPVEHPVIQFGLDYVVNWAAGDYVKAELVEKVIQSSIPQAIDRAEVILSKTKLLEQLRLTPIG